ncbi:uncharacterized protein C8orf34 homolog [Protopterus annectens]|uniref:uncharacterized protein C8orf34 homolog n=1 Tax=Protopterus annectens TaxID=7888 RepID=UPI001CF96D49|nr:uncharacterized protein C8orf34 homolog [Protopterus annectens]
MASQQQTRIQTYLEKNRIGPLFEELMTKLITETPEQPIPFLIDHLQSKQGSPSKLQGGLSGSAALWAETGTTTENKGTRRDSRSYEKPWQTNAKKPKKSKSDLAVSNISPPSPESKSLPRSIEHPQWDWRSKPESRDFDELNHILQESKKLGKALENLSNSIAAVGELDQDLKTYSSLMRPRVIGEWIGREENDADPLAAEMLQPPVPRIKNEHWDSEDSNTSPSGSLKVEPKSKGLKQQQQHHKKLLAAMLSQDSFDSVNSAAQSVSEDDIEDEDDAMELLEDLDDLRMEGVSMMPSANKMLQGRGLYAAEPQAKVTLNICSRCARLQGDSMIEIQEDALQLLQSPEQAVPDTASPVPEVETLMEEEEEFESASQVTGPRQPVWELDGMTARNESLLNQKQLKESSAAKDLEDMERHLAEIQKDISMMAEATLTKCATSPLSSIFLQQSGLVQPSPVISSRPQTPANKAEKSVQLQLQTAKSLSFTSSRPQTPISQSSRPQTPNVHGRSKPSTPSLQGSRPATPKSSLSRPLTPSSRGGKDELSTGQKNRPLTPSSQFGKSISNTVGINAQLVTEAVGCAVPFNNHSEDESCRQLQVSTQPWILPSDTESEGVEEQDKREQSFGKDAKITSLYSGL